MFTALLTGINSELRAEEAKQSLYNRLGGVYNIAAVVDDFIERLLVNDILNANPAIDAAREIPKAGLKFQVTALVCQATGGPEQCAGSSMKDSHQHLNITEAEWDAMIIDFYEILKKFKVPKQEQNELIAILDSTKVDIVIAQ